MQDNLIKDYKPNQFYNNVDGSVIAVWTRFYPSKKELKEATEGILPTDTDSATNNNLINADQCNLLNRLEAHFQRKTAPKTKKDQEKLIKALDIISLMLEPKNCNNL